MDDEPHWIYSPEADYRAVREQVNGCCFAIVAAVAFWGVLLLCALNWSAIVTTVTQWLAALGIAT